MSASPFNPETDELELPTELDERLVETALPPIITGYDKERLLERLEDIVVATEGYRGSLAELENEIAAGVSESALPEFGAERATAEPPRYVHDIAERARNARVENLVIETGHAYLYQSLEDPQLVASLEAQYEGARAVSEKLNVAGIATPRVMFIDDYNPHPDVETVEVKLDVDAHLALAAEHGFRPDYVIRESAMVPLALGLIEYLHKTQGAVQVDYRTGQMLLDRAELMRLDDEKVSCACLDAALSIAKYRFCGDGILNILPRRSPGEDFSYREQQRKTRRILREHLRVKVLPYFNVFISDTVEQDHAAGAHHVLRKPR